MSKDYKYDICKSKTIAKKSAAATLMFLMILSPQKKGMMLTPYIAMDFLG
jgi:hypothetical protein